MSKYVNKKCINILKNDIIFKAFFTRKGNEEYLKDFLGALLGIEISEEDINEIKKNIK